MPELSDTILAARNTVMERENAKARRDAMKALAAMDANEIITDLHYVEAEGEFRYENTTPLPGTKYRANRIPGWPGLFKLQEELAELGVVLAKLSAFPDGDYPDDERENLVVDLIEEMSDVQAAMDRFRERNRVPISYQRMARKKAKYDEWALTGEGE